jgi:hypothetical protein
MDDAAIEKTINYQVDIRTKKKILFGETVVINLFKSLKIILKRLIIPSVCFARGVREE